MTRPAADADDRDEEVASFLASWDRAQVKRVDAALSTFERLLGVDTEEAARSLAEVAKIVIRARDHGTSINDVLKQDAAALLTVSAEGLIASPPPKPPMIVPGLLPAGLSALVSAPKIGKSWLAYQIAVAVATGGDVLGMKAARGDVLYLALEDGEYRMYSRITSILRRLTGSESMPRVAAPLDLASIAGQGVEMVVQVETWLASHPAARLVIIDTLQKVRPRSTGRRNQYELDVEDVGRVLDICRRHPSIATLIVHHDTKASHTPGADFVDAISGTSGIGGSSDTILVLRRKRHEHRGTLEVTGKDVSEGLHYLAYDEDAPFWSIDRDGGLTDAELELVRWLQADGPDGPTAVAAALGISKQTASSKLKSLVAKGRVVAGEHGMYSARGPEVRLTGPDGPDSPDDLTDLTSTRQVVRTTANKRVHIALPTTAVQRREEGRDIR